MDVKTEEFQRETGRSWIRSFYAKTLAPLAARGLQGMFLPSKGAFCDRAKVGNDGSFLRLGVSNRYTAMALVGIASQQRLGLTIDLPLDDAWRQMVDWAEARAQLGDVGLVLWALALRGDSRVAQVADAVAARQEELFGQLASYQSMSLGWFLAGASEAMSAGAVPNGLAETAERACDRLLANRCSETDLFCFGDMPYRRNILRARVNRRLGSFASQVYPIVGLAKYAAACGNEIARSAATGCADRLCQLQGPAGQWWWIYHAVTARPVVRYPVYGVHQDAMGPMALLSASETCVRDYSRPIRMGLAWLHDHPECPEIGMIEEESGLVWRAIQRDKPTRTGGFGLGLRERTRMVRAACFPAEDRRSFKAGYRCDECRPYHLGWILLASAMATRAEGGT